MTLYPVAVRGQGFGTFKKSVVLQRKLPAAVKLPGQKFNVKVTSTNPQYKELSQNLQEIIETELAKYNNQLVLDPEQPDTVVAVTVLNFSVPPPVAVADSSLAAVAALNQKQHKQTPAPKAYKITGTLSVTYQAKTRGGRFLDANPIKVNFSETVNSVTQVTHLVDKLPFRKKKTQDEETPKTAGDVQQILADRLAARIAARLVNTDERVEAMLARGSLDEFNKYAEAKQWQAFVEHLETMPPLTAHEDDAYRQYNIGVGYEALGYQAATPADAKRYFEKAVIQYRMAEEANPHEKNFLEPENRIEIALEHYRKLATPAATTTKSTTKSAKKATTKP
jgi:RNase H-fold protein (predicted Holliday junction resolvase)